MKEEMQMFPLFRNTHILQLYTVKKWELEFGM